MAVSIVLLAAVIAVVNGKPQLTERAEDNELVLQRNMIRTNCSMNLEVFYPSDNGNPPTPVCSNWCQEAGGLRIDGVVFKKLSELEAYGLMVEVTYVNGSVKECRMVPYDTAENIAARYELQKRCLESAPVSDKECPKEAPVLCVNELIPDASFSNPMHLRLEGFTQVGNSYYMVSPERMDWRNAVKYCSQLGATLASIESASEQDYLKDVLRTHVWIDLNDILAESFFVNSGYTPIRYSNWNPGEPNNLYLGTEDCGMMRGDQQLQWNDMRCNSLLHALCEHPLVGESHAQYSCPEGYWQHKSSCYILSPTLNTNSRGEEFCENEGAYPAFINSQDEQDFLAGVLSEDAFIGYTDRKEEGKFVSSRFGIPLFQRWTVTEPNDAFDNEDCVTMDHRHQFLWNDINCDKKIRMLCEKAAEIRNEPEIPVT